MWVRQCQFRCHRHISKCLPSLSRLGELGPVRAVNWEGALSSGKSKTYIPCEKLTSGPLSQGFRTHIAVSWEATSGRFFCADPDSQVYFVLFKLVQDSKRYKTVILIMYPWLFDICHLSTWAHIKIQISLAKFVQQFNSFVTLCLCHHCVDLILISWDMSLIDTISIRTPWVVQSLELSFSQQEMLAFRF